MLKQVIFMLVYGNVESFIMLLLNQNLKVLINDKLTDLGSLGLIFIMAQYFK